jgi:3-deoxy-D-manno-octulosonic-acid transferase
VVFGPVYDKYFEADELIDAGGAFSIEDALELESFKRIACRQGNYRQAARQQVNM